MTREYDVLIVGGGQAGGEVAAGLRARQYSGSILLATDEQHLPYSRPPLSKAYLRGLVDVDALHLRPARFYAEKGIDVRTATRVQTLDTVGHTAVLDDGEQITWGKVVLATGGRPRRLPDAVLPASGNVHYVRTLADVDRLRAARIEGESFVVVGGGYVGLEIASVLARLGARITLIEAAERLLARVTSPVMSDFFLRLHRSEGVDVRLSTAVRTFRRTPQGDVFEVELDDGTVIPTDQVLVGIGMIPNTELAEAAGIVVDNGIVVDHLGRTSAPDVYAIGDVANVVGPDGSGRRLESMPNAAAHARVVADHIVGTDLPHTDVPWFWSDQYDLKLQAAGTFQGADEVVVRGDADTRSVCALYLADGLLRGVDSIGRPADYAAARKILNSGGHVDPSTLADGQKLAALSSTLA
jgi:3-phenylpropionate/trans-cinnamate dioxygenase ferredoxin reductase subunit